MHPGSAVGPYQIVRQLGAGGMGVVWLAEDQRLHRKVALKTLRGSDTDAESKQRLMREARAAAALNHPNIAAVHDVLDVDGNVIVVFEYVEGDTLASRLNHGPLSVPESIEVAFQLADGLATAHAQGVIHRDLKPSNVVITPDGRAKVLDFGIARLVPAGFDLAATVPGTLGVGLVGTPGYAAPEQYLSRNVDGRADIYALGVMLFEMITGQRPFPGNDALALATCVLRDDAPKLSTGGVRVPPALETLVAELLEREPQRRPKSAEEVLIELSPLRDEETSPLARRTVLLRRGMPKSTMIAALVAVAVVVGVIVRVITPGGPRGPDSPIIAVEPLANVSGDASNEYLGAGLAENLITSLASVPAVTVLSRGAVEEARQQHPDRQGFIQALDATYLVQGSVQNVDNRLRVTLNLLRHDQSVAWGKTLEAPANDLFALQEQLAASLSDALEQQTASGQPAKPVTLTTKSEPAQIAYWKGRAFLDRRELSGNVQAALNEFENAVAADPKFAVAYAGLAEAQWQMYVQTSEKSWADKANESTQIALKLEPDRPVVRYTAAITLYRSGKYDQALVEVERALALQPTSEDAMRLHGTILARKGRLDDGLGEFRKVILLRPNSVSAHTDMGMALFTASRFSDALAAFRRTIELSPNSATNLARAGAAAQSMGDNTLALSYYEKANGIQPRAETFSSMGTIYYGQGEFAKAASAYEGALLIRPSGAITSRNLGDAYLRLGRKADALAAYRKAVSLAQEELKVSPDDARAIARLAVYQAKAGDDTSARVSLAKAEQLAPNDPQVDLRAGVVHALAGRQQQALDAIRQAIAGGITPRTIATEDDFERLRSLPAYSAMVTTPAEVKR